MDKRKTVLLSCLLIILIIPIISSIVVNKSDASKNAKTIENHPVKVQNEKTKNSILITNEISSNDISSRPTITPTPITSDKVQSTNETPNPNNQNSSNPNNDADTNKDSGTSIPLPQVLNENTAVVNQDEPQITITPTPTPTTTVTQSNSSIINGTNTNQCGNSSDSTCSSINPQNGNTVTITNGAYSENGVQPSTGGNTSIVIPAQ